jgi:phage tail sheath gpL-like
VGAGGTVQLDRMITTYQTSAGGSADSSYYDLNTLLTLMYVRYSFRARVLARFPRHKLKNDGGVVGPGQAVVTPKTMKAECVAWFRELESLGLVEDFDQFSTDLVVERDEADVNRLNIVLPPGLVNQLVVTAISIQFRL